MRDLGQEEKSIRRTQEGVDMNNPFKKPLVLLTAMMAVLLFSYSARPSLVLASDDTSSKITDAENAVNHGFMLILNAEKEGANVSDLDNRLSNAARVLIEAKIANQSGDYASADALADNCTAIADEVAANALKMKDMAVALKEQRVLWSAYLSSLGLIMLAFSSHIVWRRLRNRYVKRILKLKPEEVKSN